MITKRVSAPIDREMASILELLAHRNNWAVSSLVIQAIEERYGHLRKARRAVPVPSHGFTNDR